MNNTLSTKTLFSDFSATAAITGSMAALVGFTGSFAVVLQGLTIVGATTEQAASALMALCFTMGICGIVLSVVYRMPISIAWSTPGAAMLAGSASVAGNFNLAVGAFLVCGVLLTLAGFLKPLSRLVAAIPTPLASAMLAGILFGLCLAPVKAVAEFPMFGIPIFLAWLLAARIHRLLAVPAALLVFFIILFFFVDIGEGLNTLKSESIMTELVLVKPEFSVSAVMGIALPLFIVTMASQNIPGMGVLNANNYHTEPGKLFATTGFFSILSAPFGGHAVNLAAITAAMCAGKEAQPDSTKRYWSAIVAGLCYAVIAVFAGFIIKLVTLAPPILIQAVAGLALISACASALVSAFEVEKHREAAAVTFFITASGLVFLGISGAFWGLVCGWLVYYIHQSF